MNKIIIMMLGIGVMSASAGTVLNLSSSTLDLITGSTTTGTDNYTSAFSVQNKSLTSSDVMVIGTYSSEADATIATGSWRLGYGTQYSTQIRRTLDGKKDIGIGSVVHVFSNVNAGATINLEHSSSSGDTIKTLGGNMVAIPLTVSTGERLKYGIHQQASGATTTSTSFQQTGLNATVQLDRDSNNGVYMAASFNSQAVAGSNITGSWKLQYAKLGGETTNWVTSGGVMQRKMSSTGDEGAITMYALEEGLEAGEYGVQLVASTDAGTLETLNGTLAAVSLSYTNATGGGYFDGFMDSSNVLNDKDIPPYDGAQGTLNLTSEDSDVFAAMSFVSESLAGSDRVAEFDIWATNGVSAAVNQANQRTLDITTDLGSGGSVGYYTNFVAGDVTVLGREYDVANQIASSGVTLVGFATEAIPEPTVMAFIALFGSGFLFIRRWFK